MLVRILIWLSLFTKAIFLVFLEFHRTSSVLHYQTQSFELLFIKPYLLDHWEYLKQIFHCHKREQLQYWTVFKSVSLVSSKAWTVFVNTSFLQYTLNPQVLIHHVSSTMSTYYHIHPLIQPVLDLELFFNVSIIQFDPNIVSSTRSALFRLQMIHALYRPLSRIGQVQAHVVSSNLAPLHTIPLTFCW